MPVFLNEHRLVFGVPLEDISCEDDLNRTLKRLIKDIHTKITHGFKTVFEVISHHQGTVKERFDLKHELSTIGFTRQIDAPTGALFWVLRHFLGLLPLPLLPSFVEEKFCTWKELGVVCHAMVVNSRIVDGDNVVELVRNVAENVAFLPLSNYLFFYAFFDLMWNLSTWPVKKLNKRSAMILSWYFSSSLFVRPYRPGFVTEGDKNYFYLTMFIIAKFPDIISLSRGTPKKFIMSFAQTNEDSICEKSFMNNSTQTFDTIISNEKLLSYLTTDVFEFDTSSLNPPTDNCCSIYQHKYNTISESCSTNRGSLNDVYIKHTRVFKYKPCCCTYSSNYTSPALEEETQLNYGWSPKILQGLQDSTLGSFVGEFIDDDYDCFQPQETSELLERVSKIGWTYTPSPTKEINDLYFNQKMGDYKISKDNYNICFDVDDNDHYSSKGETIVLTPQKDEPQSLKIRKSTLGVIRSKFDLFKNVCKKNLNKSSSLEEVPSKVKYEKIDSARSTTF